MEAQNPQTKQLSNEDRIRLEANLITARKLLHMNVLSKEQIAQACSLTVEDVNKLEKKIDPFPDLKALRP